MMMNDQNPVTDPGMNPDPAANPGEPMPAAPEGEPAPENPEAPAA